MGVHILTDGQDAVMYCSTSGWAFGPVFDSHSEYNAEERIDLFLEWMKQFGLDVRVYTDSELSAKHGEFLKVEEELWKTKEKEMREMYEE